MFFYLTYSSPYNHLVHYECGCITTWHAKLALSNLRDIFLTILTLCGILEYGQWHFGIWDVSLNVFWLNPLVWPAWHFDNIEKLRNWYLGPGLLYFQLYYCTWWFFLALCSMASYRSITFLIPLAWRRQSPPHGVLDQICSLCGWGVILQKSGIEAPWYTALSISHHINRGNNHVLVMYQVW